MQKVAQFTLLAALSACGIPSTAQQPSPLILESEIVLPGVQGRIDHLSADVSGKRLFVSALGNGTVEVLDLNQLSRIHQIPDLKEPQGVVFDPHSHRLFVACGGDGTLRVYDVVHFALLKTVSLGDDADNVRYDLRKKQIVVGYGDGGLASFDADLNELGKLKLPSHPESFQLETTSSLLFVNLPKSLSIDVVDLDRNVVVHSWKPMTAFANFPMALDESDHRLFVGFREPARLLIFNAEDGKVIQRLPIVGDTDDLFFDPVTHHVYVIGGEGFIDVLGSASDGHFERIVRITTRSGARTGLFVPSWKRLLVALPRRNGDPAKVLIFRVQ